MANTYTSIQIQKSILNNLYNRYENVAKNTKLAGEPMSYDAGQTTALPYANFQSIYQQKVEYNASNPNPYIITVKDLQRAINYLEGRFNENCDCPSLANKCQTCQTQCTYDNGSSIGCQSCQYTIERIVCQSYACQTIKCQSVSTVKSCESCQSCQYCQKDSATIICQSCQLFSCQTLRCEAPLPQCSCQECQTNCSQCSCQSNKFYDSCQSQCI